MFLVLDLLYYCKKLVGSNRILSIQNISFETLGIFRKYLKADGFEIKNIIANQKNLFNIQPSDYDVIFILGGPMSVNDNIEYLNFEKRIIEKAFDDEIPVMGICLGSQLLAWACGGIVYPGPKKEIGWTQVNITPKGKRSLFNHISNSKIKVFQWHGDTFTLPKGVDILSYSDLYIQSFRYKRAFGIQFHLEVTSNMIKKWADKYRKDLASEKIDADFLISNLDEHVKELEHICKPVYKNFMSFIE